MSTEQSVALETSADLPAYINDLLREALENRTFPETIWIGVNGFKGGCGNTILSMMLSTAAITLGFKVIHVPAHRDCHNFWKQDFEDYDFSESHLMICKDIEHAIKNLGSFDADFVIMDLPRDAFCNFYGYDNFENLIRSRIHVLLSPVTAETGINNIRALESLGSPDPLPLHRRMLVPLNRSYHVISMKHVVDTFAEFSENISDMFLSECEPLDYDLSNRFIPVTFKDSHSEERYQSLLGLAIKMAISRSMDELRELREID